jgi:hypothetical protein
MEKCEGSMSKEEIISRIREAFRRVEYPGDWCLRKSNEGEEPYLLEKEFQGKTDWTVLDADFLDQAPGGFSSALSFFSDEAFHFYLPAYIVCDLQGELKSVNVCWYLTHGLNNPSKKKCINKKRYGERTWWDAQVYRFSMLNEEEVKATTAYLEYKLASDEDVLARKEIKEALENYWYKRVRREIK